MKKGPASCAKESSKVQLGGGGGRVKNDYSREGRRGGGART